MKKKNFGKILVIGLVVLFAGASVLPSIGAVNKTTEVQPLFEGNTYFILLNEYTDGAGQDNEWSVQIRFDSVNSVVECEFDAITLPLIYDQWTEIKVDIDLDGDWMEIYYDGAFLHEKEWTAGPNNGYTGSLNIGAVDLFANGATTVYWDDLSLEQVGTGIVWSENFDSYVAGSSMHGQGGWKGWDNDPTWTAYVSNAKSRSPENSVDIKADADLVHEYDGYNSGQYIYTAWIYIPTDQGEPPGAVTIEGPDGGKAGTEYTFTVQAFDPDGQDIRYHFNWGDELSEYTDYEPSGDPMDVPHTWAEEGVYTIQVYAEDTDGMQGPITEKEVNMPRSKSMDFASLFLRFLQNHPNMFPIIRALIGL